MSYQRRVTMELPNPFDFNMPSKVQVDGDRVPATKEGIRLLREAIMCDREQGLEPPHEVRDL